jgi:Tfp pilus assembly protein FimV
MTSGPPAEPVSAPGADTGASSPDDTEELKAKIEQTREQLGRTAEQLAAKADVKARAQGKVTDLTQRAKDTTSRLRDRLPSQASASLQEAVTKGTAGARKHRAPLIIAVGVLVVGAIVVRSWTRR